MPVLYGILSFVILLLAGLAAFSWYTARRVEQLLPPLGKFIDIQGTRIHYLEKGNGPPLVLIHGLGGQMRHFTYALMDSLAQNYRVVAFDRPGSGYSHPAQPNACGIIGNAATIAQAMKQLGLEKARIVGHSMGGAVALALALDHPETVSSLALVAPLTHQVFAPPDAFKGLAIQSKLWRWIISWTIAVPLSVLRGKTLLASVFAPEGPPKDFPMRAGGLLGLRPSNFRSSSSDMVTANDDLKGMVRRYASLSVPVHVFYGEKDEVLDYRRHALALKDVLPQTNIVLTNRGHMLPITASDETFAFINQAN